MTDETANYAADDASYQAELEGVLAEYLRGVEAGNAPHEADLLQSHPGLAPDLKSFFENRRHMEQIARPLRPGSDAARSGARYTRIRYLGDYELLDEIGCGGMGVIFKARQTSLQRTVAVKMVLEDRLRTAEDRQRFRIEAEAAASLEHPNILPIYEVGEHEGQQYFSMKLVDGSLSQRLDDGPLPVREAACLMITVARAVQFAHERGILHRDLKPANILIDAEGDPFVTDFGLAKRVENKSELTHSGAVLGTPAYMAPEQAAGQSRRVTTATDVYGLGAILYATLAGRAPFQADNVVQTLKDVVERDPARLSVVNSKIDRDLETICLKCLEKAPSRRYASAEALARDLERYIAGEPVAARPVGSVARLWRWCRRSPVVAGLSALSCLAVAATVAVLVYSRISAVAALDRLTTEQAKTQGALAEKTVALGQKTEALNRLSIEERKVRGALTREQFIAYPNTLTLARREWMEGNLARAVELLDGCSVELRNWEWFYMRRICDPASLHSVTSPAALGTNRLPITSDGRTLFLYHIRDDAPDKLVMMNTSTGAVTPVLDSLPLPLSQLAVSGDSQLILRGNSQAAGLATSTLELHNAKSGASVFKAELPNFSLRHIAINHDGTMWAASGSVWQTGAVSTGDWEIRVWKRESPESPLTLPAELHGDRALWFSPDKSRLLTSHFSHFELWETVNFKQIAQGTIPEVNSLDFGEAAASFHWDSLQFACAAGEVVTVYDTVTGELIRKYHLANPRVNAVAFGAGDKKLAYGTAHGKLVMLDLKSGKEDVLLRLPHALREIGYSPDGTRLVTFDESSQLRIWDANASPESDLIPGHAEHDFTAAFDPSGAMVAAAGDHQTVLIWETATKKLYRELTPACGDIYDVAFSPDGTQLAAASRDGVQVWALDTGALKYRFAEAAGSPFGWADRVEFSRRGNWLVVARAHGATSWDLTTGAEVRSFAVPKGSSWMSSARFNADARRLVTCGQVGGLQLWDTATGRELFKVKVNRIVYTVAFSRDEKQIVACGVDKDILIVDAETGAEMRKLSGHAHGVHTVAFSSDGKRLVSAGRDGVVKIWDAETGLELLSFQANEKTCYSAAFSPDSRRLVTTEPGGLRIWDAGTIPKAIGAGESRAAPAGPQPTH